MDIRIHSIPHDQQRYDTAGNWITEFNTTTGLEDLKEVRISQLGDENAEFVCGIHEAIEAWWCRVHHIIQQDVDEFDIYWEETKPHYYEHEVWDKSEFPPRCFYCRIASIKFDQSKCKEIDEPGNDPKAPYHVGHMLGLQVERVLIPAFNMNWEEYNRLYDKLDIKE